VIETMAGDIKIRAIVEDNPPEQGASVRLNFQPAQTRLYRDGWIASTRGGGMT
jgi:glycerol transport system ATP-binding protein